MGWVIVVSHKKGQFEIVNLLEVESKPECLKNKHFTNFNVWKCAYGS